MLVVYWDIFIVNMVVVILIFGLFWCLWFGFVELLLDFIDEFVIMLLVSIILLMFGMVSVDVSEDWCILLIYVFDVDDESVMIG